MSTNSQHSTRKYPRYPAYRPSGIDWLGDIPEKWEIKRLKYVASSNTKSLVESTPEEFVFRYLDIGNVGMGYILSEPVEMAFRNAPSRARRVVQKDDTIISTVRTYLKAIYHFEVDPENVIVSTGFAVIKPQEGIHPKYFYYLSLSENFIDSIVSNSYGVSYPAINESFLMTLPVWQPSWREQKSIVDFLDRKTALIDDVIAKKQKLIELLKEKRQALITQAVTKGLDPNAKLKPSGIEWLGDIPEGWEVSPLRSFARPGHKTFVDGDWIEAPFIRDEGVRLIQTGNIGIGEYREQGFRYIDEETFRLFDCTEVKPSDVLICRLADPVGRACIAPDLGVKMITSVDVCILKPKAECDTRFLIYVLSSSPYLEYMATICRGSTRDRISRSMLGSFRIQEPSVTEQRAIADFLDHETAAIDGVAVKVESQMKLLKEYRQALITSAVTGKIDVRGK